MIMCIGYFIWLYAVSHLIYHYLTHAEISGKIISYTGDERMTTFINWIFISTFNNAKVEFWEMYM